MLGFRAANRSCKQVSTEGPSTCILAHVRAGSRCFCVPTGGSINNDDETVGSARYGGRNVDAKFRD